MNIEDLNEELVAFINKHFPELDWDGVDSSADADIPLDTEDCIDSHFMHRISVALQDCGNEEFTITIHPQTNKLILYFID